MEAHDLTLLDVCSDGDLSRLRVGAEHPTDEEVALLVLRLSAIDHDSHQHTGRDQSSLTRWKLRDDALNRLERGATCQLVDQVTVGGCDGHLASNRRRSLGDAGQQLDPADDHPDGTFLDDLLVE